MAPGMQLTAHRWAGLAVLFFACTSGAQDLEWVLRPGGLPAARSGHAMTFDEVDAFLGALAEAVLSIRRHFEHSTFGSRHRVMAVVR